jgi:hypothetical protein
LKLDGDRPLGLAVGEREGLHQVGEALLLGDELPGESPCRPRSGAPRRCCTRGAALRRRREPGRIETPSDFTETFATPFVTTSLGTSRSSVSPALTSIDFSAVLKRLPENESWCLPGARSVSFTGSGPPIDPVDREPDVGLSRRGDDRRRLRGCR